MPNSGRIDETDSRLLHALQIEPRASWQDLAPIVGVDAGTLARRWARLRDEGIAWSTGYTTQGQMALLELECEHGHLESVAGQLRTDREAAVVDFSSGARDLLALVATQDLGAMADYTVGRLARVPGIRTVRTHLFSDLLMDASNWRLRALTPAEAERVPPPRPPRPRAAKHVPDELVAAVMEEVWRDGRCPIATIAERSGYSPQRISDALATLRNSGALKFRTDIARTYSEWPIYAWYFIEAPARVVEAARRRITSVPEVRLAAIAASRYNLILAVWLRRLADLNRLEIALTGALEGSRIADRAVVLNIAKHLGRALGSDGRASSPDASPRYG